MVDKEEQKISDLAAFYLVKICRWELLFSYLSCRPNAEEVIVCILLVALWKDQFAVIGRQKWDFSDFLPFHPFSGY